MTIFVPLVRIPGEVAAPGITVSAMIEREATNIIGSARSDNRSLSQLEVAGMNGNSVTTHRNVHSRGYNGPISPGRMARLCQEESKPLRCNSLR
jgi:hypothetical protein